MNSLDRISAAMEFRHADRVPVIAQVFGHAAALCGVPLEDYVSSGEVLARCQTEALRHYGYDAVFSVMDVNVETEAAGSVLRYHKARYPVIERYALLSERDLESMSIPDPQRAGRMPEMLKALGILRAGLRDEVLVVGCVLGPFTLTTQLLGTEAALFMAVDDPAGLEAVMDFATETILRFGTAQIKAGAHLPIVFNPSASPAVIPPNFFRELELPRLKRIFRGFAEAGAIAGWLHIAGPIVSILPYYEAAGVGIANFDYFVSAEKASGHLPSTCLDGNIRSISFIEATSQEIEADAMALLGAFRSRGGFILSSGCEIPPESRPENVAAMVNAVHKT